MMFDSQLLKIRIKPGKTPQVVGFFKGLLQRQPEALAALRKEGIIVESFFLERRDQWDYLYYYVKSGSIPMASRIHGESRDPLIEAVRAFIAETWDEISSPEPLLDLDLIPLDCLGTEAMGDEAMNARAPVRSPG